MARWSRTDTALASAVCDMWAAGISTRKVEAVASDLGLESMSRSRVSRLCEGLDGEVSEMRGADLSSGEWPYLWLDATYVPCREAGAPRSVALVTAVACSSSARRRVVGVECIDTESYLSWRAFLLSLRARGLSGVRLVTSDAHEGLVRAVREALPGAAWQRCIAHLERNVLERCRRKGDGSAAVAALKAAFAEADPALVRAGYRRAVELLAAVDARGGGAARGRRPGGARLPRVPAGAPPLGEDQQRLRAHELRDQEAHEGGAGVPVGGVAGEAGRGGVPRPERRVGVRAQLHRQEEPRAGLRARAPARGARRRGEGPQARRGGVRQEEEGGVGYGARLRPRGTARTPLFVTRYGLRCITIFSRSKR